MTLLASGLHKCSKVVTPATAVQTSVVGVANTGMLNLSKEELLSGVTCTCWRHKVSTTVERAQTVVARGRFETYAIC